MNNTNLRIPNILLQVIQYLLRNGEFFSTNLNLHCEPNNFENFYSQIFEGHSVNLEELGVGGVIKLLKKYLLEKKPVAITDDIRDKLIEVQRFMENNTEKFQGIIESLPDERVIILDYVIYFCWVLIHQNVHTVHSVMLARFLVPLLFQNTPQQLIEGQLLENSLNYMILHYDDVFKNINYHEKSERKPEKLTYHGIVASLKETQSLHSHIKKTSSRVKILSLDGGGIRGLVLVRILSKISEILFGNADEDGTHRLLSCFDIICGTSTGGILSVALSSGFSLKRARETYYTLASSIFSVRYITFPFRWSRYCWSGDYYDSDILKKLFKDEFGDGAFKEMKKKIYS